MEQHFLIQPTPYIQLDTRSWQNKVYYQTLQITPADLAHAYVSRDTEGRFNGHLGLLRPQLTSSEIETPARYFTFLPYAHVVYTYPGWTTAPGYDPDLEVLEITREPFRTDHTPAMWGLGVRGRFQAEDSYAYVHLAMMEGPDPEIMPENQGTYVIPLPGL